MKNFLLAINLIVICPICLNAQSNQLKLNQTSSISERGVTKDFYLTLDKAYTNDSTLTAKLISMMPPEDKMPVWWKPSVINSFKWTAPDMKESVSALKIPIRAINASWVNTNEELWKSFYSDYKLTVFENSNHFLVWQYPQKFNETLLQIINKPSTNI